MSHRSVEQLQTEIATLQGLLRIAEVREAAQAAQAASERQQADRSLAIARLAAERSRVVERDAKSALDEMRALNARLTANTDFVNRLLASSDDCIKVLDLEGRLRFMSEGGHRIMEVDNFNAIAGCPWPDFWSGESHAAALAAVAAAKAGGTGRFRGYADTMKGTRKFWDVQVTAIKGANGRPEYLLSISRDMTQSQRDAEALRESEAIFKTFAQVMPNQVWAATAEGQLDWFNDQVLTYSGLAFENLCGSGWAQIVHPDDVGPAVSRWTHATETGESYQTEFRLQRYDGVWRWHLARAESIRNEAGDITRWIGTNTDFEDLKANEAERQLLSHELEHRLKNTLAMVSAIANQSFRSSANKDEAQRKLAGRLMALSQAHEILTGDKWLAAPITNVVERTLAPHRSGEGRIKISGPDIRLSAKQATALALALHELATNAAKYGALSNAVGFIQLGWTFLPATGDFQLEWREAGGPPVTASDRRGFGSRLIERTLQAEFGGKVLTDYKPEGLIARLATVLTNV